MTVLPFSWGFQFRLHTHIHAVRLKQSTLPFASFFFSSVFVHFFPLFVTLWINDFLKIQFYCLNLTLLMLL